MINVFNILKDQVTHFPLIVRLAIYEIKGKYQMHYLGILWQFLNPFIQVCVYWFVFGIGLRSGKPVGDTPFLIYLLLGLIPWFFISPTIVQGSNSIYSKINLVSKMKFPVNVLPTIIIVGNTFNFLIMLMILIVICYLYGVEFSVYLLQLPYYILCMYAFIYSVTILTSTISTLIRDFQLLIQSTMRLFFFMTPIFWSMDNFSEKYKTLIELNPFTYIVNGFRDSFLTGDWFYEDWSYMFYFWSLTFLLLFVGSIIHNNFKNKFVDYL